MALHWKLDAIKNYKKLCWVDVGNGQGKVNPVTDILIYMTMFVGMNEITPKNHKEFFTRTWLWEKVSGCFLYEADPKDDKKSVECPISYEDIVNHIGLSTNASSKTKTIINKNLWQMAKDAAWREVRDHAKAGERQDDTVGGGRQEANTGSGIR